MLIALIVSSCDVYDAEPRYDARDKVIGRYDVEEYSETYNQITAYSIYVGKSGYNREIYIDNFYASNIRVYAYLDYDRITIPFQIVNGYEVEGAGTVYGSSFKYALSREGHVHQFIRRLLRNTGVEILIVLYIS